MMVSRTPGTIVISGVALKSGLRLFENLFLQLLSRANVGLMLVVAEVS
jgi:hypothetical protein